MKRLLALLLLLTAVGTAAEAQLSIDGRRVMYDSKTNTMLATVPRSVFGTSHRAQVTLDEGWKNLSINGVSVKGSYSFYQVSGTRTYTISVQNSDDYWISSTLKFTFLPMVQINGSFGYEYADGTVSVIDCGDTATHASLPAQLRWRGGTTNAEGKHKRNYKIKFQDDQKFFSLRSDNVWILDAGQADLFRVRNRAATDLWLDMASQPYYADDEPKALSGARGRMVELFLGKEYRGIYCLTERIDRKQMKLKKTDSQTGQIRGGLWKAESYGASMMSAVPPPYDNTSPSWDSFEVKYPKLDDVEETDYSTLWNAINFVATSTDSYFSQHFSEYFDMPVLVDYYVLLNALNLFDNDGKNVYWAVYDKTRDKRLTLAVWDLDASTGQRWVSKYVAGTSGPWSPDYEKKDNWNLYARLKRLNVDSFNERVVERYQQLRQTVLSTDSLTQRYMKLFDDMSLSGAAGREEALWSEDSDIDGEELNLEQEIYYISYWLARHLVYLDQHQFFKTEEPQEPTSIDVTTSQPSQPGYYYNLNGQRLTARPQRNGIYVKEGRKTVFSR